MGTRRSTGAPSTQQELTDALYDFFKAARRARGRAARDPSPDGLSLAQYPVSYTHLTLPTIYSV